MTFSICSRKIKAIHEGGACYLCVLRNGITLSGIFLYRIGFTYKSKIVISLSTCDGIISGEWGNVVYDLGMNLSKFDLITAKTAKSNLQDKYFCMKSFIMFTCVLHHFAK